MGRALLCFLLACGGSQPQPQPVPASPPPPPSDAAAVVDAGSAEVEIPAECQAYIAAVEKLGACRKLPPETEAKMEETVARLRGSLLQTLGRSPEARDALIDACKKGGEAVTHAMTSAGC